VYFRCCGYHYYEGNDNHFIGTTVAPHTGRWPPLNSQVKAKSSRPLEFRTPAADHRTSGRWRPPIAFWHLKAKRNSQ